MARKLIETRVLTVASPSYVKAHGKPRHPKEIEERDCINFYDAANARPYDWEMKRKKEVLPLRIKARLLVSDSGTLLGACQAGAGIAQVLEIGCGELLRGGELVELLPEWSDERFPLYAVYPSRLHRAAKVRAFVEFCLEIMGGNENAARERPGESGRFRFITEKKNRGLVQECFGESSQLTGSPIHRRATAAREICAHCCRRG